MMVANVTYSRGPDGTVSHGTVRGLSDSDTYVFDSGPWPNTRWIFRGKVSHDVFIPASVTGYEHIPQEFFAALDESYVTNSPVEFPDPLLDSLAVQGA